MKIDNLLIIPDKQNIEACMALATQKGLGFEYNDFFLPSVLDSKVVLEATMNTYKSAGKLPDYCTLHGAFLDVVVFSDDPLIRQVSDKRVEQSIEIAIFMGAKSVIFHTNYVANFNLPTYENNWIKKNAEYWSEKLSKHKDINIYIENMFDVEPELLARLGEELKDEPRFGVCFDYAHANVFGDESKIEDWVTCLAPYVKHIHINDNDFLSDLHLPVGQGKLDWNKFREYYRKYFSMSSVLLEVTGYDKIVQSLEYIDKL